MAFFKVLVAVLLLSVPLAALAGDEAPPASGTDSRYPVPLTPEDALRQKGEMRNNLVALRNVMSALADKNFVVVEESLHHLAHTGPAANRPGASTAIFRNLERGFEASVNKTIEAARSRDSEAVLRALGDTLAYCQSCHMTFRQEVEHQTGEPAEKTP